MSTQATSASPMHVGAAGQQVHSDAAVRSSALCRVLHIEANEDGTVGGSHRALVDLVTRLDRGRFEPVVLFYQHNRHVAELRQLGVTVHVYEEIRRRERAVRTSGRQPGKTLDMFLAVARRADFLRRHRIDLVHINNSPRVGNGDWLPAARLLGIRIVCNVMGDASGSGGGRFRSWLFRSFDHYLTISDFIDVRMEACGIPARLRDRIYLGVDIEAFRARASRDPARVRSEMGVAPGEVLAVTVGNVREWKGQHVVLEALRQMPAGARGRLRMAFVGGATAADESYAARLRQLASSPELDGRVSFLGARDDVPDLVNAADVAIHASIIPEPFGLVVMEALALGKPVIAANTGGPAEVIRDGAGFVFDPAEPKQLAGMLARLVEDESLRRGLAEPARRLAEEYSAAQYAAGVQAVFEGVMTRAPRWVPLPPLLRRRMRA